MLIPTNETSPDGHMQIDNITTPAYKTSAIDIRQGQMNMIENQIRATGIHSQDIFDAFSAIRRENFVPEAYRNIAYADTEIPLIHNETMLTPRTEALVLHAADIKNTDHVLEIGAGSGFMAALLAYKAQRVTSVEIKPELKRFAQKNLDENGIPNVRVKLGNGAHGWKDDATYDVIIVSGALLQFSDAFLNILNPGGRMIFFIGSAPFTQAQLIRKIHDAHYETINLFGTSIPLLREQTKFSGT